MVPVVLLKVVDVAAVAVEAVDLHCRSLRFFSQPFFVHVNTAETKATKDNASGTKVISNVGLGIPSLCDQHRVKGKENCILEED